ncbi:hypothetical protein QTP88_010108 [Uroleucon formosanum]
MFVVVDLLGPFRRPEERTPLRPVGDGSTANVLPDYDLTPADPEEKTFAAKADTTYSFYSVCPEVLASYMAKKCGNIKVAVDPFCGAGGNVIQLSKMFDKEKILLTKHNSIIYEVFDKIEFIVGDFFTMANQIKVDVIVISPPWGGRPDYNETPVIGPLQLSLDKLLAVGKTVVPKVLLHLPKNIDKFEYLKMCNGIGAEARKVDNVFMDRYLNSTLLYVRFNNVSYKLPSDEIREVLSESDSEAEIYHASDEDEYCPEPAAIENEESDADIEHVINHDEEFDSDESNEDEFLDIMSRFGKDGTQWHNAPFPQAQTSSRNILRQKPGLSSSTALYTAKEIFKSIMTKEMCDIILRETKRKGQQVTEDYNKKLTDEFPGTNRPTKTFKPFTEEEFDAFLGILLVSGVHRSNKEHLSEMWKFDSLPLIRAAMPRDRFKMLLRFIRFDNVNTRNIRITTDKAAPIRDIWTMLNYNLQKNYKPTENITVDEQLFPYRGHTKFTQYIPSKPAKYGIKIFWACDAANAYPLQGKIYTGKPQDGERQVNVGERTVLDLVATYKGSGRNVTTDNFFTSMHLATTLNS